MVADEPRRNPACQTRKSRPVSDCRVGALVVGAGAEERGPPLSDLKRAALWYAAHRWPVVALHSVVEGRCSCCKPGCGNAGKHPRTRHGLKDARIDDADIDHWWNRWPDANIGVKTGVTTGIVVIDVDPRHGGDESLAELVREYGDLPSTVEALTGGGGRHLVFKHPGGTVRNRSNLRPGIDVRGDGGYIVAPPSNHMSGGQYRWREGHGPHEMQPAEMPAWLLALVCRRIVEGVSGETTPAGERAANHDSAARPGPVADNRVTRALAAMRGLRVDDHKDGSRRLFAAASIAVRHDLADGAALATIREYLNGAPAPREYSDADILKRLQDAERTCTRGQALRHGQARRAANRTASAASAPPPAPFKPFPVDALPDPLRVFVKAVAAATGTDVAFAALAALVVVAGCIGNRVAVLVKSGWIEPAVLWGMLVGRSGTTKSPVLKLVTRALIELFKVERRAFRDALKDYQREFERHGVRLAEWKKSQRKGPPTDPPDEPERPTERRLVVSDVTVEKLGCLLEENPLGLLLVRDELAAWVGAFDRYASGGKGSDQPAWLSMYDAAPVTIDRKSGKGTYFVERAAVSVVGSIQPGTLARIFGTAEREAGLLARVLLAYPPDRPALWTDAALPDDVAAAWRDLLSTLLALPAGEDELGDPRPRSIPIGKEAKPIWIEWHDRHARELVDIGNDDLAAHYAKLKGACARIALLFTCVDVAAGGDAVTYISAAAMRRAIQVTEWFKGEARRVYAVLGETEEERSRRRLVEWIDRRGGDVSVRDLTHGLHQYRGHADAAKAELDALAKAGLGSWTHPAPGPKGGRPSPRFVLNSKNTITKTPADDAGSGGFGCGDGGNARSSVKNDDLESTESSASDAVPGAADGDKPDVEGETTIPGADDEWGEV
ncbi:MAG: DUF3987 domain-containing protein [Planctomycetota bacterium]|nr:MAG: DUF3987 domain-containing protein [Planctomycetota bacterium]